MRGSVYAVNSAMSDGLKCRMVLAPVRFYQCVSQMIQPSGRGHGSKRFSIVECFEHAVIDFQFQTQKLRGFNKSLGIGHENNPFNGRLIGHST